MKNKKKKKTHFGWVIIGRKFISNDTRRDKQFFLEFSLDMNFQTTYVLFLTKTHAVVEICAKKFSSIYLTTRVPYTRSFI